jgi:hypothetical protein
MKMDLKEHNGTATNALILCTIWKSERILWIRWETFGLHNIQGICWSAGKLDS